MRVFYKRYNRDVRNCVCLIDTKRTVLYKMLDDIAYYLQFHSSKDQFEQAIEEK